MPRRASQPTFTFLVVAALATLPACAVSQADVSDAQASDERVVRERLEAKVGLGLRRGAVDLDALLAEARGRMDLLVDALLADDTPRSAPPAAEDRLDPYSVRMAWKGHWTEVGTSSPELLRHCVAALVLSDQTFIPLGVPNLEHALHRAAEIEALPPAERLAAASAALTESDPTGFVAAWLCAFRDSVAYRAPGPEGTPLEFKSGCLTRTDVHGISFRVEDGMARASFDSGGR